MKKIDENNKITSEVRNSEKLLTRTKEKLIKSEERFRNTLNNLDEAYFSTSLDGTLLEHNQALNRILGFDVNKDLKGFHIPDLWESKEDRQDYLKKLLANDSISKYQIKAKTQQGKLLILLASAHLIKDEYNRPQRIEGIFLDITERKLAEETLRASEEKFELAFKHSPIGICISALSDGRYVEINDVYSNFLGYSREELIGRTSLDINLWVDMAERDVLMRGIFQNGSMVGFELRFRDRNGKIHWGYTSAALVTIREESYLLTQTQDITEKKMIEEEFEKSEAKYHLLADHTKDKIWLLDLDLNVTYISPSVEKVSGYTPGEIKKMPLDKLVTEASLKSAMELFTTEMRKALEHPPLPSYNRLFEFEFRHKDGHIFPVEANLSFILDANGKPVSILGESRDITERKQAEQRILFEGQRFRALADYSLDIILLLNTKGVVTYINPAVEKILGYKVEERIGQSTIDPIHPDDLKSALDKLKILATDTNSPVLQMEMRLRHKDGSWRIFETVGSNLVKDNVVETIIIRQRDITERKKAEESLRREEQLFRSVTEQSSDVIIIADKKGFIIYENPAIEKALGFNTEERIGSSGFDLIHPDDLKIVTDASNILFNEINAPVQKGEVRFRHKDGGWRTFEATASNLVQNNVVEGAIVNLHDITKHKKAEESLRQSEEKYRTILENMQEGYFEIDLAGNFTFVNDSTCRDLGYAKEELMGMNNRRYTDKENAKKLFQAFNEIYKTGNPLKEFDWQIIRKDGIKRYTEGSISLKKNPSGKPIGFTGVAHDITERKQAEEAIRQNEEKYRLLADHMKDQVWIMDLNLKLSYVSPSVEKILGYTFEELNKLPLDKLLMAESFTKAMDFFSKEMSVALVSPSDYVLNRSLELEFCCKDGRTIWGENKFSFIRNEDGKPVSILGEGRNITERKQMEDALRKSEENFRRSLDSSPLGVRISTVEGKTIYANRAILDIYGYDNVEELENTPLQERYTPESYAEFQIRKQKRLRGEFGPSEYEVSIVRKDGEMRHLYVFRKEIFWSGKKQSQVIYQDITMRRRAEGKLNETLENLRRSIKITIQVLGTALEAKDPYMVGHQKRVSHLARAIATEMKLSHDKIEAIRMASDIHDIGKISIPAEILCKPAILTELEFSLVKNHSRFSYEIIKEVESPWPLADIVHQHHERIDGSGYPLGLKNADILIESRILAVADVVEAMTSYRPYRPALGIELALAEIENNAGILYDRNVVNSCLKLFREKNFNISLNVD